MQTGIDKLHKIIQSSFKDNHNTEVSKVLKDLMMKENERNVNKCKIICIIILREVDDDIRQSFNTNIVCNSNIKSI